MEADEYALRPYLNDDLAFIQSSWGYSYYKGANYSKYLSPEEFHKHHRPIREALFLRPNIAIVMAVAEKDPALILGWIAVEKPKRSSPIILHYIYVKQAFKDLGIGTYLLKKVCSDKVVLFTHLTERAQKIMNKNLDCYDKYFFAPHLT